MSKNVKRMLVLVGVLVIPFTAIADGNSGGGGAWDITGEHSFNVEGGTMYNGCATPPQILETEGMHQNRWKLRRVEDEDGNLIAWDMNLHGNHQGVKAIGYDLVVDEDGNPVEPLQKAVDENGEYITTEYSIPGTYNFSQQYHLNEGNDAVATEVFMCNQVSHGSAPNVLLHYNKHINIDSEGNLTLEKENSWCKCTGGGPEVNGHVDCDEWPASCVPDLRLN